MSTSIVTTPEADQQVLRADEWWRENRPAGSSLFTDELAGSFAALRRAPQLGKPLRRKGIPGLRRLLLPRTRYHLYYVFDEPQDQIIVLSVWSAVRGRGPRLSR